RTYVDDTTRAFFHHATQNRFRHTVNRRQVCVDDVVPLIVFHAH
ncbi:hypothetical protein D043_4014B, partial [Vibrio parahaemolyticus EKP-021]